MTENKTTEPMGPIASALAADLEEYQLEDTPSGRTLAAGAMALAKALDREANAAAAKELRLFIATLNEAHSQKPTDDLLDFLTHINDPELRLSPPIYPELYRPINPPEE